MKRSAPVYRNALRLDPATIFASGIRQPESIDRKFIGSRVDLRLGAKSKAVDAGEVLPGFNDGYKGQAPDLGAFERGDDLPHYGPRRSP